MLPGEVVGELPECMLKCALEWLGGFVVVGKHFVAFCVEVGVYIGEFQVGDERNEHVPELVHVEVFIY